MKAGVTLLDLIQIGNKLTELRQNKNYTQDKLAELLFVSHQAVSKWERGLALPSVDNLCFLIDLYEVSLEEILCLECPKKEESIESLFKLHDRQYVIRETVLSKIKGVSLPDILHLLTNEERLYALYLMVDKYIAIDDILWPRLSTEERFYLIHQYKEKKANLNFELLKHLMSQNEIKKIKGESHENYKHVTIFGQSRNYRTFKRHSK